MRPLAERRVRVSAGIRSHIGTAIDLDFPLEARLRASALPDDLQCAVRVAVAKRDGLEDERRAWIRAVRREADLLRPISARINTLMPPSVAMIANGVNTAWQHCPGVSLKGEHYVTVKGHLITQERVGCLAKRLEQQQASPQHRHQGLLVPMPLPFPHASAAEPSPSPAL